MIATLRTQRGTIWRIVYRLRSQTDHDTCGFFQFATEHEAHVKAKQLEARSDISAVWLEGPQGIRVTYKS